ncbi:hypothetical protein ACFRQP_39630, partial [Kitasatospora sp. NPDC056789]
MRLSVGPFRGAFVPSSVPSRAAQKEHYPTSAPAPKSITPGGLREARMQLGMYLAGLVEQRIKEPRDDLLSDLAA